MHNSPKDPTAILWSETSCVSTLAEGISIKFIGKEGFYLIDSGSWLKWKTMSLATKKKVVSIHPAVGSKPSNMKKYQKLHRLAVSSRFWAAMFPVVSAVWLQPQHRGRRRWGSWSKRVTEVSPRFRAENWNLGWSYKVTKWLASHTFMCIYMCV